MKSTIRKLFLVRHGDAEWNQAAGIKAATIRHSPRAVRKGPGHVSLNMRFSRTFGFRPSTGDGHQVHPHSTDHSYNLTLSVMARNILNTTSPGVSIGNLSSPLFN